MKTQTVAGRTWHFTRAIGRVVGSEGFYHPTPIVCGPGGSIYVANTGGAEGRALSRQIDHMQIDGKYIRAIGNGDYMWPEGLALDDNENLYLSDAYANCILVYDRDGKHTSSWGEKGSAEGQIQRPAGIAVNGDGNILVVDSGNHRVQTFSPDGVFIATWGAQGSGDGELDQPWGIHVDRDGDIYVADWGNDRVQKFGPGGGFLRRFGSTFDDGGTLHRPSDVAVDSDGDVYVVDWGNNRVQIYDTEGDIITGLYGDATDFSRAAMEMFDANPDYVAAMDRVSDEDRLEMSRFERPRAITIDDENRIAVTDCTRCRVQVYEKDKDYVVPQFNL